MFCHGIGGMMERPASTPINFPERRIFMKSSDVHVPVPVAESGERLAAKEMPHGPTHAVRSLLPRYHLPGVISPASIEGNFMSAGEPERRRVVSGMGPSFVIIFGE